MDNKNLVLLKISNLHHPEMGQLAVRYFEDFANAGLSASTDADYKKLHNALSALLPTYKLALDQVRANEESDNIAKLDKVRDEDFMSLKKSIQPYRTARNDEEMKAYKLLAILFDQYKGVESDSYESETIRLNNLLTTLADADHSAAAATLGIQKFIDHLAAANTDFNDLFSHRSTKISQKVSYDVKKLRKELEAAYRRLANFVATMADVKDSGFFPDALAVLNVGRKYFADLLARRSGGKGGDAPKA